MTTQNITLADTVRWTADIGMFALDRSREDSCVHASDFCHATCFNDKLETAFGHAIGPKDVKNDKAWLDNDADALARKLERARRQTKRARFMTRGEAFKDFNDIPRVRRILEKTPNTTWWIPTRAWKNPVLWIAVLGLKARFENVRILASVDPSDSEDAMRKLEADGVSTMFYGDDDALTTPSGTARYACPKTHHHAAGFCALCRKGCFNAKQVHVHLKQH